MGHYYSEMRTKREELADSVDHAFEQALEHFREATKDKWLGDIITRMNVSDFMTFLRLHGNLQGTVSCLTFSKHVAYDKVTPADLGATLKILGLHLSTYDTYLELKAEYDALPQ